jgi:hypothetical protein
VRAWRNEKGMKVLPGGDEAAMKFWWNSRYKEVMNQSQRFLRAPKGLLELRWGDAQCPHPFKKSKAENSL